MSKVMKTTGLPDLLRRIAGEYAAKQTIFDIPEASFHEAFGLEANSPGMEFLGYPVSLPVGPAAGPNSQIAPNLVAAYLSGARVFELKTVQEHDSLDIEKPCIDARDEGHNTEWSTELSLTEAREEYLRAWIAIQLLAALFSPKPRELVFNMSVGYTLAGIKSDRVDAFIEGMRDPAHAESSAAFWKNSLAELAGFVRSQDFEKSFGAAIKAAGTASGQLPALGEKEIRKRLEDLLEAFPSSPIHSLTISTMHGCPPKEIEGIGAYLIEDKGFDTFVKLNPTLLGYDEARRILDCTGWQSIELHRDTFEHDLQFDDAIALIESLSARAKAKDRRFGIKLSNTLANVNPGNFLPGGERYMSGRALYPLTVSLAARLAQAIETRLPDWNSRFSYCGGVWALNAADLISAGLGPLTVATDILKPGGYLRLLPVAEAAQKALAQSLDRPDPLALKQLAEAALSSPEYRGDWKEGEARIARKLPLFDCFAAPCVEACPVGQKVPAYIALAAEGKNREALDLILEDNALPAITGTLCDHVCQEVCCRHDYEGSVEIRGCKLAAVRKAGPDKSAALRKPSLETGTGHKAPPSVAVIGAGPAGLSCAYHLALAGAKVKVYDSAKEAGGVPANVIPRFRIEREALASDIDRLKGLGVEFCLGSQVSELGSLKGEGFGDFFLAAGAPVPRQLKIEGEGIPVVDALSFLEKTSPLPAGIRHVVVAGGGNTAMDAVRVALKMPGIQAVTISYRRGRAEMPADREELETALAEGGRLLELSLPERASAEGSGSQLQLRMMALGERDASGRRSPHPTEKTATIPCDLIVAAVGEDPDLRQLAKLGAKVEGGKLVFDSKTQESSPGIYVGGDASRGPSSIIAAEADGRRAAYAILEKAGIQVRSSSYVPEAPDRKKLAARGKLAQSLPFADKDFARQEAERCLKCDSACLRCVEVCPNRANFALPVAAAARQSLTQAIQILHIDALCNECGNCGIFCPYEGEPYRGKPTLFDSEAELLAAANAGFAFINTDHSPASEPELLVRDQPRERPRSLPFKNWSTGPGGDPMISLARTVWFEHPYLLGGAQ